VRSVHQAEKHEQDGCADEGNDNMTDEAARLIAEQCFKDEAANHRTHQADDDVINDPTAAAYKMAGEESRDEADGEPDDEKGKHRSLSPSDIGARRHDV
jgi:hypothetical protein